MYRLPVFGKFGSAMISGSDRVFGCERAWARFRGKSVSAAWWARGVSMVWEEETLKENKSDKTRRVNNDDKLYPLLSRSLARSFGNIQTALKNVGFFSNVIYTRTGYFIAPFVFQRHTKMNAKINNKTLITTSGVLWKY